MKVQVGDDTVALLEAGDNSFPSIDRVLHISPACFDGPIAVVTKESVSTLHVFHRTGKRLSKRRFGGSEGVLAISWTLDDTLTVVTTKGLVYFFSMRCTEVLPPIRLSRIELFRAFSTADCVITQQDRSEIVIYPISHLLSKKETFIRFPVDCVLQRVVSASRLSVLWLHLASTYVVWCISCSPDGQVTIHRAIDFENPIELLERTASEQICIYEDNTFHLYTSLLDRRIACISLDYTSITPIGVSSLSENIVAAPFKTVRGGISVVIISTSAREADEAAVDFIPIHLSISERFLGVVREVDALRVHTTRKSYVVQRIEESIIRFRDPKGGRPSNQLKSSWWQYNVKSGDVIDDLLPLLQESNETTRKGIDDAIEESLTLSVTAFDPKSQQEAFFVALYGMKFTLTDWTSSLIQTRLSLSTRALLRNCALPMALSQEQLETLRVTRLINRCVEYSEYNVAFTLSGLYGTPHNDITRRWATTVITEKALSDQEALSEIVPKMRSFKRADYERIVSATKAADRPQLLDYFLRMLSKDIIHYPMLMRLHVSMQDFPAALQLAEYVADADVIVYILSCVDARAKKTSLDDDLPLVHRVSQDLHAAWKSPALWAKPSACLDRTKSLADMSQKWTRFMQALRKSPSSEWHTLTSKLTSDMFSLAKSLSVLRNRGKRYSVWITSAANLLSEQCVIAKSTGNIGFVGKTFHETVIMCHSYRLAGAIDGLARHFHYSEETKFWLYLLFLCEIKDWYGADRLINEAHQLRRVHIGPGVTEVLWEHGRYAHVMQQPTEEQTL